LNGYKKHLISCQGKLQVFKFAMLLTRVTTGFHQHALILIAWMALLTVMLSPAGVAADDPAALQTVRSESSQAIRKFLENALKSETSNLADVEQSIQRLGTLNTKIADEIDRYRIQNTSHGNMLLISLTPVEALEAALNSNRLAIKSLTERIVEVERVGTNVSDRKSQLEEQLAIAERQKHYLAQAALSKIDANKLQEKLKHLIAVLQKNKSQAEDFLENYNALFDALKVLLTELTEMREQLEARLQEQIHSKLYERTLQPFARVNAQGLKAELTVLQLRLRELFAPDTWRQEWRNVQRSGGITQSVLLLLFAMVVLGRRKIRGFLSASEHLLDPASRRNQRLAISLLRRALLLICAVALLWFYDLLKLPHVNVSLARFLNHALFTLLFARWCTYIIDHHASGGDSTLHALIHARLYRFFQLLPVLVLIHLSMVWLLGRGSVFVWCIRITLEAALLAWVMVFWRRLNPLLNKPDSPTAFTGVQLFIIQGWSFIVALGAVLMEVVGFGALAGHWLVSWAETLIISLWATIAWQAIQEWRSMQIRAAVVKEETAAPTVAAPIGWFLVQMTRLLWLIAVLSGILLSWSSAGYVAATLKKVFNLSFSVGSLSFSVKGLLMAVVIVCATHMLTRIGRRILRENVLNARELERGLKDSIIAISTYLVWGGGLLLALGFLGVNTTSLAVVFGALSIGIGFGLQNIFNNFVSGLILLFERPIQVGDYVDIDGLWAEVKQINVRSTIVQTFDNATVIIPNSDFISQRVTNWSFKDPRMRRHVDVGVAYGSDIELVRNTLLDIAAHTQSVLKYPPPDVLFMDHADSALVFRLRYWTHVDNYYTTSTDVRFALDRRFRELGIEIAFPQRDLHVRSVDSKICANLPGGTPS
jgi:small-conductance mechanosensitive channel